MNGTVLTLLVSSLVGVVSLQAQTTNALSGELKQSYNSIKTNLEKAAEDMPEENYGFKPTPDIRTFGALVAHIADAQTRFCSVANGEPKTPNAGSKTSKADIVAALKDSFAECDKVFDGLTDAASTQMVKMGRNESTKMGLLARLLGHDNEEYGYLAVYLRLKGVVPPSSQRR